MRKPGGSFDPSTGEVKLNERGISRFWANVNKKGTDECWLWIGANGGHCGQIRIDSRIFHAPRISWLIHFGKIPEGLCVLHDCPTGDNGLCVNPNHLWLGTQKDNMVDMTSKGRCKAGEVWGNIPTELRIVGVKHPHSKLDDNKVRDIIRLILSGESQRSVANRFGVSRAVVVRISKRKSWKHVIV